MTRKEKELLDFLRCTRNWQISEEHSLELRKAARGLHRWDERECNGEVYEDEDGQCWGCNAYGTRWKITNQRKRWSRVIDDILRSYSEYLWYHQTDPRGCSVYIHHRDLENVDAYYNSKGLPIW